VVDEDRRFDELRALLRQPDRRSLRRHLRRAAAVASPEPASPLADLLAEDGGASSASGEDAVATRRHPWRVPVAVVGVATALVGVTALRTPGAAEAPGPEDDAAPSVHSQGGAALAPTLPAPSTTTAVRVWPAEPVEVEGTEVRTGGHRWRVGEPGDVVVVGDWDCDRLPSPAVLRPTTGAVAVFSSWPGEGEEASARTVRVVPGAVSVRAAGRCGALEVVGDDGAVQVVPTVEGAP
jgi:hypothetical protein